MLVNSAIRSDVKPIFFSQTRLVVGNTARCFGTPPTIAAFRKILRYLPARDLGYITKLTVHIRLKMRLNVNLFGASNENLAYNAGRVRLKTLDYITKSITKVLHGLRYLGFAVFYDNLENQVPPHPYPHILPGGARNGGAIAKSLEGILSSKRILNFRIAFHH
jgi:hypothetical protein